MTEALLVLVGVIVGFGVALLWLRTRIGSASTAAEPATASKDTLPTTGEKPWDLLDQIGEGVLLLDERLRPVLANAAAGAILGLQGHELPGRLPSEEVVIVARRAREEGAEIEELMTLWFPSRATIKARAMPIDGGRAVLLILQDVTEELLAQRIRREFVAHASHELKSPVASMQALAEAVHQAAEDDPRAVSRFSHKLVLEAARLSRLISDLLDLSRLEDPGIRPEEPTDLAEVAHWEVAQARTAAESKCMTLEARVAPHVWVRGDDQQLSLLIRNLLENAIRYTSEGGTVSLEVELVGETAVLSVSDTGIGIPLESQGRVFERFYRVDRARSRDKGGTGLGLAIVKHVAELHGGEVTLSSELGVGSTFTTRIPALKPDPTIESLAG